MAQDFAINGTTLDYIMTGDWREAEVAKVLDGQTVHNRWRQHVWQTNVMDITEFDTLYALEGAKVTLTTTDHGDRNGDYVTYYNAELRSIASQHVSYNMESLRCEFLVRM